MEFVINRKSNISIYYQIYSQIRDEIFSGEIAKGVVLGCAEIPLSI